VKAKGHGWRPAGARPSHVSAQPVSCLQEATQARRRARTRLDAATRNSQLATRKSSCNAQTQVSNRPKANSTRHPSSLPASSRMLAGRSVVSGPSPSFNLEPWVSDSPSSRLMVFASYMSSRRPGRPAPRGLPRRPLLRPAVPTWDATNTVNMCRLCSRLLCLSPASLRILMASSVTSKPHSSLPLVEPLS